MNKMLCNILVLMVSGLLFSCYNLQTIKAANASDQVQRNIQRLHNIWVLKKINDIEIDPHTQMKGLPVFEFHVSENRFMSNGGCNHITGAAHYTEQEIKFGNLMATRMMCPNMEVENKIISNLSGQIVKYTFEEGSLVIEGNDKLELKKVD